jgi:hypothetical protein
VIGQAIRFIRKPKNLALIVAACGGVAYVTDRFVVPPSPAGVGSNEISIVQPLVVQHNVADNGVDCSPALSGSRAHDVNISCGNK